MSIVGSWILAPLVAAVLSTGLGLLLEAVSRVRLPGPLVPVAGFAVMIVLAATLTVQDATAELAVPVVALCSVAGLVMGRPWSDPRLRRSAIVPLVVATVTYLAFAAPSLLTGHGSVAGYVKLDDTPTWLAHTVYVLEHGRDTAALPVSSYGRTIGSWLGGGYPVGSFLPLGLVSRLSGQDPAGAYQPMICVFAALLALGLFACARGFCVSRRAAAVTAGVGAQASLLYGYAQWGGIKEIVTAALLPLLAFASLRAGRDLRVVPVLAIAAGAVLAVLGPNGAVWAAPALAVFGLVAMGGPRLKIGFRGMFVAAAAFGLTAVPLVATLGFLWHTRSGAISQQGELGNLARPISLLQGAGLWPTGDFRQDPSPRWFAVALAVVVVAAAVVALVAAVRARRLELPVLLGITLAGVVPGVVVGSPWVDAKALAVLSPMVLAMAVAVAARPLARPRPWSLLATSALMVALPAGVAWSTFASVDGIQVAPRARLDEARAVGQRVAGDRPALLLDPEIYASRYFLREADGEGASDLRVRPVARRDGGQFARHSTADVDEIAVPDLWVYRSLVHRRSPSASRPPTGFSLVHAGRFWEAWRREPEAPAPLARLPLSTGADPTARPACIDVQALARTPGARRLAAVPRRPPVIAQLDPSSVPRAWAADGSVRPVTDGRARFTVSVPTSGRWRAWVGGSVLGRLDVRVDGRDVGHVRHELALGGQWMRFAALDLESGSHRIEVRHRARLRAGTGRLVPILGPFALSPETTDPVEVRAVGRWRELCDGRTYDWVEALR